MHVAQRSVNVSTPRGGNECIIRIRKFVMITSIILFAPTIAIMFVDSLIGVLSVFFCAIVLALCIIDSGNTTVYSLQALLIFRTITLMLLIAIMILTVLRGRQYAVVALQKIMLVCSSFSMCLLLQLQAWTLWLGLKILFVMKNSTAVTAPQATL